MHRLSEATVLSSFCVSEISSLFVRQYIEYASVSSYMLRIIVDVCHFHVEIFQTIVMDFNTAAADVILTRSQKMRMP